VGKEITLKKLKKKGVNRGYTLKKKPKKKQERRDFTLRVADMWA